MKNIVHFDNYVVIHLESFSSRNYRKVYGIEWDKITSYLTEKGFKIILLLLITLFVKRLIIYRRGVLKI